MVAKEVKRTPNDKTRPPQTAAKRVDLRRQNAITRGDKTKEKLKPKAARQPEKKKKKKKIRDKDGDSNLSSFFVPIRQEDNTLLVVSDSFVLHSGCPVMLQKRRTKLEGSDEIFLCFLVSCQFSSSLFFSLPLSL